jgi:SAM-dependent methyltransferase
VESESVDKIVSFHALEHVDSPFEILRQLRRVLRPDGEIKIFVPCDVPFLVSTHGSWAEDPDFHLNSWTPMTLGNLMTVAGFAVTASGILPGSEGGRLAALFPKNSAPNRWFKFLKACRNGRFDTFVIAKPRSSQ